MKIVILDGYTLNPGDLDWSILAEFGHYKVYNRTTPAQTIRRSKDADIILTNKTVLSRDTINQLPKLKYIGVLATGYNVVDIKTAREKNVTVTNIPAYGTPSVTQMVFAHLLNFTQHVAQHAQDVRRKKWCRSKDFCYWDYPLTELAGLTMGIVGFGRIGQAVSRVAQAFDMHVLAFDTTPRANIPDKVKFVDLETLFHESDVVSLHCPLTDENRGFVSAGILSMMKKTAFLINTGRGPLINEQDLADALNNESIAGAGLDVLEVEPPRPDCPLLNAKNCWITPHISWATRSARQRLLNIAVENIKAFLDGNPKNTI